MSIALGNKKPDQLIEVEKIIWRALFKLSEGTIAPEDVLDGLLIQIPWQKFQPPFLTLSQQDSEWFMIPATTVSAAPTQNIPPVPSTTLTSTSQSPVPAASIPDHDAMDKYINYPPSDDLVVSDDNVLTAPSEATTVSAGVIQNISSDPSTILTSTSQSPVPATSNDTTQDPTASSLPDHAMDQSPDYEQQPTSLDLPQDDTSPRQAPLPTASSHPNNNAMDQSPDYQQQPPSHDLSQDSGMETDMPVVGMANFIGFGAMNKETPSDDTIPHAVDEEADITTGSRASSEPSLVAPTHRRSTRLAFNEDSMGVRLALEKSNEDSMGLETSDYSSRSTSPVEPKRKQHQPTTPLKRKAPTGEGSRDRAIDVDSQHAAKLLSPGGSRAKPIDVDALHAVLEKYPLKREPQVCRSRTSNHDIADEFSRF
jgi:hypothetical protein